jgi:putative DNA methylase
MIPKECKRLAEVDFPIAVVSKHAAREKSIRHGHPSTLHLWWARRPLAACRAMLLGLLLPDPCDEHCPEDFKTKARELLPKVQGQVGPKDDDLQKSLLKFIGDFANWDLSADRTYLEVSRGLVTAAHPEEKPLVVDPFAGGGSIPLEALRLGCEVFASDLNPVACLILTVLLGDIPRHGPELADELRRIGANIRRAAEKKLVEFYPPDPDGSKPIAYLWARTISCEQPDCGAEIPLARSFWLCKKTDRKQALKYEIAKVRGGQRGIEFEIFKPKSENEVPSGTVTRAKAVCPCCNMVLSPDRVRAQLRAQRGGVSVLFDENGRRKGGAKILAVVTYRPGEHGRRYRLPNDGDYGAVKAAMREEQKVAANAGIDDLVAVPDEPIDEWHHDVNRMPMYGMMRWGDLFTSRQKLALITLCRLVRETQSNHEKKSLQRLLALAIGRSADQLSSLVRWLQTIEAVASTFGRQALPIVWDYCEICPTGEESANFGAALEWIAKVIENHAIIIEL